MRKLDVIEDGMMPDDIVRWYFPEMDEDDVDWVLFNKTVWPYGSLWDINDGVYEYYLVNRHGDNREGNI